MTVLTIVNGFFMPTLASIFFAWWITWRFVYGYYYMKEGPEGRIIGRNFEAFGFFGLIGLTCFNAYSLL